MEQQVLYRRLRSIANRLTVRESSYARTQCFFEALSSMVKLTHGLTLRSADLFAMQQELSN